MNFRFLLFFLLFSVGFQSSFAQDRESYLVKMDLTKIENDRIKVQLFPPKVSSEIVEYVMPSVIPGSYSQKDYGRFIDKFRAYNKNGKRLRVKELTANIFQIQDAQELDTD